MHPIVQVIDERFEIPQLIKTRRIAALLPASYAEADRRYPVLYLQDGQNLFDDFAPFGSWELRTHLAEIAAAGGPEFIVIAIDHAERERIAEFTPSMKTRLGRGDGEAYATFLAETLKPYVDARFRTLADRDNTGIGGSSMGGLVSLYAACLFPQVYSRLMLFSPSFWVSPELPGRFIRETPGFSGRIYAYGGGREGSDMVPHLNAFAKASASVADRITFRLSIHPDGQHNEAAWGAEFPSAATWLFTD